MRAPKPMPNAEQMNALRLFAKANPKDWKKALSYLWYTGRYESGEYFLGGANPGYLQQIRNSFGPSWLQDFRFARLKLD